MSLSQAIGKRDADRAHGDMDGVAAKRRKAAAAAEHDSFDRCVISKHGDNARGAPRLGQAPGDLRAVARQGLGLASRPVVDRHPMAGLEQVPSHRLTHVAEPDKAYVHVSLLSRLADLTRRPSPARSLLWHSCFAQRVEELRGVLVSMAKTPYREAGSSASPGFGFGLRLFQLAQVRQRRPEEEMRQRVCPIDLDRAAKQRDGLLVGAKSHFGTALEVQPEPSKTVVRRKAQRLFFMRLSFFRAADKHLGQTDVSMSCRQIRVQRQRSL